MAGRPSKYKEEYADLAYKFALLGATDVQMAEFFGVDETTLIAWKKRHRQFRQSITRGKIQADAEVVDRLYQRAKGYSHPEEKIFNNNGEVIRAETTRHYPPDTQAASLWLRNRQPALWRDTQRLEHTGKDGKPIEMKSTIDPTKLSNETLRELMNARTKADN